METVFVFTPEKLESETIGFLQGFSMKANNNLTFYITNEKISKGNSNCVGYCSETAPVGLFTNSKSSEWIHLNSKTGEITVYNLENNKSCDDKDIICISYDYNAFVNSDIIALACQNYGEYFETLAKYIRTRDTPKITTPKSSGRFVFINRILISFIVVIMRVFMKFKSVFHYSTTLTHLQTSVISMKWLVANIRRQNRLSVKVINILFSKILDVVLGIIVFYYFLKYENVIFTLCQDTTESIIKGLAHVLSILMGSPAGLKLNYSFNKTLGIFFFYHIALWRAFIHVMNPVLQSIFHILIWPGVFLGLSYQFAIISDLIAFFTFQVYCIYVYAARLFGVQIRGITSLFKLFIGRKYNPLRKRVDSFQYTRHQLFIGTLGFTVLLFLLPTTFLYYAVFTTFRLLLKLLELILSKIRYMLQYLPVYVLFLWLRNSPSIKGSIYLSIPEKKNGFVPTTLKATLKPLPLLMTIKNCSPDDDRKFTTRSTTALFQCILYGKLI